jgi:hypothetical protein
MIFYLLIDHLCDKFIIIDTNKVTRSLVKRYHLRVGRNYQHPPLLSLRLHQLLSRPLSMVLYGKLVNITDPLLDQIVPRLHRELPRLKKHHLRYLRALLILLQYGQEDAVNLERVAGQFAQRTHPTRVHRLRCHHNVIVQVETVEMRAEDAPCRVTDLLGTQRTGQGNLQHLATHLVTPR